MSLQKSKSTEMKNEKTTIYYSRDYRHLGRTGILYSLGLAIVLIPAIALYLLYYSDISFIMANFAKEFLEKFTGQDVYIFERSYLPRFGNIYCVTTRGSMPDFTMALLIFIISMVAILLLSTTKVHVKPLAIFFNIGFYFNAFSALFFMICPNKFPYTVSQYSELYMKQQIILWLMVLVIYIISISLVKGMYMIKFITLALIIFVMGVYGILRYALYLAIVVKGSYIFMASLFFTFGVLFDFMIMVAIYALFMKRASIKYRSAKGGKLWKWS